MDPFIKHLCSEKSSAVHFSEGLNTELSSGAGVGRGVLIKYRSKVCDATAKIDVNQLTAPRWTPRIFESAACRSTSNFFRTSQSENFGDRAYFSAILSDAAYACAVHRHFSTRTLKDEVKATWEETFYPDGFLAAQAEKITES